MNLRSYIKSLMNLLIRFFPVSKNKKEVDSNTAPPLNSNNKSHSASAESTNNKKNASIFARLFARPSKSQEDTKALTPNSKPGVSNPPPPPTVPEHKGTESLVNENAADDLFELIEKESAELMEPLKN